MTGITSYENFVHELHDELFESDPSSSALCTGIGEDRLRVMLRDGTEHFFCGRYALEIDPTDPARRLYIRHRYTDEVEVVYNDNWVYAFVERAPIYARPGPIEDPKSWIIESTVPNREEGKAAYITGVVGYGNWTPHCADHAAITVGVAAIASSC